MLCHCNPMLCDFGQTVWVSAPHEGYAPVILEKYSAEILEPFFKAYRD